MNKLPQSILSSCTLENCCQNEIVILPTCGDAGFEKFFDYKADLIRKAKNLFAPVDQCKLILTYPEPPSQTADTKSCFPLFFESPSVVAHNQDFEGCFGIDITSYVKKTADSHFF